MESRSRGEVLSGAFGSGGHRMRSARSTEDTDVDSVAPRYSNFTSLVSSTFAFIKDTLDTQAAFSKSSVSCPAHQKPPHWLMYSIGSKFLLTVMQPVSVNLLLRGSPCALLRTHTYAIGASLRTTAFRRLPCHSGLVNLLKTSADR
jgi:hypothetical protein